MWRLTPDLQRGGHGAGRPFGLGCRAGIAAYPHSDDDARKLPLLQQLDTRLGGLGDLFRDGEVAGCEVCD